MVKYFCDRCGAESKTLSTVQIPTKCLISHSIIAEPFELCPECKKQADDMFHRCSEIRVVMFKGFMQTEKGGAE